MYTCYMKAGDFFKYQYVTQSSRKIYVTDEIIQLV